MKTARQKLFWRKSGAAVVGAALLVSVLNGAAQANGSFDVVGYRFQHEEYDHNGFNLNLDTRGLLVGVGFHF